MSLFQIILKQLRQRSLSTILTILSVMLGVALATAILIVQREGDKLFGQSEFGFDLIVGPKGSKLQLVLNNVYQVSEAQGTIPYSNYSDLATRSRQDVRWLIPIATGDSYRGHKLLATQPKIFETPALAKAREAVNQQFAATRAAVEPLLKPGGVPVLPVPPNSPVLPQLFALQQQFDAIAKQCAPFDPEITFQVDAASRSAMELVDALATSEDRAAIQLAIDALLDHIGGANALIGGPVEPRPKQPFVFAAGRPFEVDRFECVLGSEVAEKLGMKVGDSFQASHGASDETAAPDAHDHEERWTVVGILKPSQTAFDRVILIPLTGFFAIPEHDKALTAMAAETEGFDAKQPESPAPTSKPVVTEADHDEHDEHDHAYHMEDGRIILEVPRATWQISSIIARSRDSAMQVMWKYRQSPNAMAVNPAQEMRDFTRTFLRGSSTVLLLLAILVSVVAAVSILVSIYNSIASRRREIAVLRALGATRTRILSIICLEAGVIGLIGSILGVALGMGLAAVASAALDRAMGEGFNWAHLSVAELLYFVGAVALAVVAGLVPALKAYSTSVAENLVAE